MQDRWCVEMMKRGQRGKEQDRKSEGKLRQNGRTDHSSAGSRWFNNSRESKRTDRQDRKRQNGKKKMQKGERRNRQTVIGTAENRYAKTSNAAAAAE